MGVAVRRHDGVLHVAFQAARWAKWRATQGRAEAGCWAEFRPEHVRGQEGLMRGLFGRKKRGPSPHVRHKADQVDEEEIIGVLLA